MKKAIVSVGLLTLMIFCSSGAGALTLIKMDLGQLTAEATCIVIGTVTNQEGMGIPVLGRQRIFTNVTVNVEQWIKGFAQTDELVFRHLGGRVGNKGEWFNGAPTFTIGDKILVFLAPNPWLDDAPLCLVGSTQGRYFVRGNQVIQAEVKKELDLKGFVSDIKNLIADPNERP